MTKRRTSVKCSRTIALLWRSEVCDVFRRRPRIKEALREGVVVGLGMYPKDNGKPEENEERCRKTHGRGSSVRCEVPMVVVYRGNPPAVHYL
jgi:hypothetical protein